MPLFALIVCAADQLVLTSPLILSWLEKNLGNAIVCFSRLCSWSISFDLSTHSVMTCKTILGMSAIRQWSEAVNNDV